jgi:Alpha/beta hydrolase family
MPYAVSADGTRLAYDATGHGPALVIVGGALSDRRFSKFVKLAELLARDFTAINYDRRGRGDSGDAPSYAIQREIEDLTAVIEAVGGRASVLGFSSGAVLAARAAAAGAPIDQMALYEPPFLVDDSRTPPAADFLVRLEALLAEERRGDAMRQLFVEGMGMPRLIPAVMRLLPIWRRLERVAHTIPYDWTLLGDDHQGRPLRRSDWAAATAPATVFSGSKSPAQLRSAARALAEVLPRAEHRELAGQSHNPSNKVLAAAVVEALAPARQATVAPVAAAPAT